MVYHPQLLWLSTLLVFLTGCGGVLQTGDANSDAAASSESQVVARFADTTITLREFEEAYVESGTPREQARQDSVAAYERFLEQYVNYRLKLRAAREARLDTLPGVQKDIHSYRRELARPRLLRTEVYEPLLRTLYERRAQEVDVRHILIRVPPNASPEDTLSALQTMEAIADSLDQGVPFADLAYRNSDDPAAQQEGRRGYRGHIGYLRAGEIVEPFEDRMYQLEPGEVSDIFRTQFGYHLIKVHDRRPARQPIRLSHIFLRSPEKSTTTRRRLDSLRTQIVEGRAEFSEIARTHSEDPQTASRGGDLGEISSLQTLPEPLRQAVTELDSVGAVSEVVKSSYGYHLLKLTDRKERPSFEEAYDDLRAQISGQRRVERQKRAFAQSVRAEEGVHVDTTRILQAVNASSVDSLARPLLSLTDEPAPPSPPVASLGDSTYTLPQLAQFLMEADGGARLSIDDLIEEFLNEKAFHYAMARLEKRDSSFAATMKKFREGTLLFQFMQDSVWTPAVQDTAGLRSTYEEHPERYRYPDRVRTIVFRAPDDSLLAPYPDRYDEASRSEVVQHATTDSLVAVDTIFVTDQSPEVYQQVLSIPDGALVGPLDHEDESLLLIRDTRLPARPKSFEEARSRVRQDLQSDYEKRVVQRLRERYNVETFPHRLREAFDEPAASTP